MARKVIHLDCEVFKQCHSRYIRDATEALCGTNGYENTTIPNKVTCKKCFKVGAKMSRILRRLSTAEHLHYSWEDK